jgi:type IV pilus assembly protein PilW
MSRARRRERGFTLVELMISLVLFSFAIAGVLAVAVSMSQGFREQRAAVGAEGAVRIPLDFIADALRQASPAASTGLITDTTNANCGTSNSAFSVSNNQTSVNDATITGWDQLDVIYASGAVVTSTRAILNPGRSTTVDVNDASQLAVGDFVAISSAKVYLFQITGIAGSALTLNTPDGACAAIGDIAAGALVIRAQHAVFTIDAVDGVPTLMMDPDAGGPAVAEPLAEGVEDMQIVVGVDRDGDGKLGAENDTAGDADEWVGNNAADTDLTTILGSPPTLLVRAVRITLVARTTSGLVGNATPFFRPAVEDHAAAVAHDTYRRRVLSTVVEIRNMAGSP